MLIDNKDALTAVDDCNYKIMSGYEWIRKQEIKKRLMELPSADACENTCEITRKSNASDLISRQVVIDMLEDINAETEGVGFYYDHWVEYIRQLPSAEVKGDLISREDAIDALTEANLKRHKDSLIDGGQENRSAIRIIMELPSAEHTAHIRDFTQYQIDWLTAHDDLELEPELESWVIRFLKDTADCYEKDYLTSAERTGKWIPSHIPESILCECDQCGFDCGAYSFSYCPNCGARMVSEDGGG